MSAAKPVKIPILKRGVKGALASIVGKKAAPILEEKKGDILPRPFVFEDMFPVGEGDIITPYDSKHPKRTDPIHWGQLKLFLSELDFITRYWDPVKIPNPVFVYAGAAAGYHLNVIHDMFPTIRFALYDEGKFDIKLNEIKEFEINHSLFTENDVQRWKQENEQKHNVFLISDIRSLGYKGANIKLSEAIMKQNEELVKNDMDLQASWVKAIKPVKALLKFRLPYGEKFNTQKGVIRTYLDGIVYRQAFPGAFSTECRLVPNDPDEKGEYTLRDWNYVDFEGMLFHHNMFNRGKTNFINPITGEVEPNEEGLKMGLTMDYDSSLMFCIVKGYLQKYNVEINVEKIYKLCKYILDNCNPPHTLISYRGGSEKEVDED